MIAAAGYYRLRLGEPSPLTIGVESELPLQ
jgi:hypothetical protein